MKYLLINAECFEVCKGDIDAAQSNYMAVFRYPTMSLN